MDITIIKTTPQSIIKLSVTKGSHLTCEVSSLTLFTLELFGQGLIYWSCQLNSYDNYIVWGQLVDTYHTTSELPILSLYFILVTLFVNNYCLVYYFNEMVVIDVTSKRILKKYICIVVQSVFVVSNENVGTFSIDSLTRIRQFYQEHTTNTNTV